MKKGKAPSKKSGAGGSRKGESGPSASRKPAPKAPAPAAPPPSAAPKGKQPAGKPAAKSGTKPGAAPTKAPAKAPNPAPAPKPAAKPAPKAAGRSSSASSAAPAAPAKGAKPAKGAPVAKGAARPAAVAPIAVSPKVEAPKKFQREYKKWLERLILLRHALLRDGERLEEEGLKALEQEVSVDHMADFGSDSYEQDNTLALIESKSEALRDVDESIRKIEAGSYGLCEECEQLIPTGRLEVLPHARYCVNCQSKREGVVE